MTDEEARDIKKINAELLLEKSNAQAKWHEEVRSTLSTHSIQLAAISASISGALALQTSVERIEARLKGLEDFKLRASGYLMGAFAVCALLWKFIDHLWK